MINYPASFEGESEALPGLDNSWRISASGIEADCSIPPAFEGPGGSFSPEDLYMLSLQNCFIATFKVFAHYSRLAFKSVRVEAKLIDDKDSSENPWMERIDLNIRITGIEDRKKADLLVKKTLSNGFILRSVKTHINPSVEIN